MCTRVCVRAHAGGDAPVLAVLPCRRWFVGVPGLVSDSRWSPWVAPWWSLVGPRRSLFSSCSSLSVDVSVNDVLCVRVRSVGVRRLLAVLAPRRWFAGVSALFRAPGGRPGGYWRSLARVRLFRASRRVLSSR